VIEIRDLLTPNGKLTVIMSRKGILEHYDMNDETAPEKIKADVARIMSRKPPELSDDELAIMYGDEAEELELARQRLELRRLEAEVEETLAEAAKDRAEADRQRRLKP
jgi:hypothetical protein